MDSKLKKLSTADLSQRYPDEGDNVEVFGFQNKQGHKLVCYGWQVPNPQGVVVGVHGVTTHARFEFLNHVPRRKLENCKTAETGGLEYRSVEYEGSLIEKLNKNGLSFFALDLQSHGESEGWSQYRCSFRKFEDLVSDVIQYMSLINDFVAIPLDEKVDRTTTATTVPMFLIGCSMGGCISLQVVEKLDETQSHLCAVLRGCILIAPMLSLRQFLEKPVNRMLQVVAGIGSRLIPNVGAVDIQPNFKFPYMDEDRRKDKLVFSGKIRFRVGHENLSAILSVLGNAHSIGKAFYESSKLEDEDGRGKLVAVPPPPSFIIIHSKDDSMCDPEGSMELFEELKFVDDKSLQMLEDQWHCLLTEPGGAKVCQSVSSWISQRLSSLSTASTMSEIPTREHSSNL